MINENLGNFAIFLLYFCHFPSLLLFSDHLCLHHPSLPSTPFSPSSALSPSLHSFLHLAFRGYLVAAPSVFRAGVEESVSVTIFNAKAETRVKVQLSVKGQTVAHNHGSVFGENKFRNEFEQ